MIQILNAAPPRADLSQVGDQAFSIGQFVNRDPSVERNE